MTIYIIERDNPYNRPEPEVVLYGNEAFRIVEKEYENQLEELEITQEQIDEGKGCYGCYWEFENDDFVGSASIDSDYDGDSWSWRITEHVI